LAPVSALVWGYDIIKDFVSTRVAEKLRDVPPENIVTPKPNVAGPILESLRYTGHEETLREMYANLLAASMNKATASSAHPAFAEIIRQLVPDEARVLSYLSLHRSVPLITARNEYKPGLSGKVGGNDILVNVSLLGAKAKCEAPEKAPEYIDNICRLGLATVPENYHLTEPNIYDPLENSPLVLGLKPIIERDQERILKIVRKTLQVTPLGNQFLNTCVITRIKRSSK